MSKLFTTGAIALAATLLITTFACADNPSGSAVVGDLMIKDAYARAASPSAKAGAAFMVIMNTGEEDDHLIGVQSDAARATQLHTHLETSEGVMLMRHDEDGFDVPAGGMADLKRGGDHVMMMGLTQGINTGDSVPLTLTFEKAGEVTIQVPVDLQRKPSPASHSDH